MAKKDEHFENLPRCVAEYIKTIVKKMRYRKKVRADVQAELAAHFEDALKDCKSNEEKEKLAKDLIAGFGDVKLLAVLARRAKKRCRPLWRTIIARTFQAIGLLILFLIVYIGWFLTGKPAITTDYVAEFNRIVRPTADESLNAAPFYNKAAALVVERPKDLPKPSGKSLKDLTTEEKQKITEWVSSNEKALEQIALGNQKPYYWRTYSSKSGAVIGILVPYLSESRDLGYALCWRAMLRAEQKQYLDCFEDVGSAYRLGQHIKGDVTLIEQLVAIAIESAATKTLRRILSEHEISPLELARLAEDFEQLVADENFSTSLKGEKFFMYDEIQRCFTGKRLGGLRAGALCLEGLTRLSRLSHSDILESGWTTPLHVLFTHPDRQESIEMADNYWVFWKRMVRKTPAQIHAEGINFDKQTMKIIKGNILLEIMTPALDKVTERSYRNRADIEATLAVMAILRFEKEKSLYPESLNQLIKTGLLKEIPMDPYSDKPLVYKKTDTGFTLYSVGPNFIDDNGQPYKNEFGKIKTWVNKGDAVLWPVN